MEERERERERRGGHDDGGREKLTGAGAFCVWEPAAKDSSNLFAQRPLAAFFRSETRRASCFNVCVLACVCATRVRQSSHLDEGVLGGVQRNGDLPEPRPWLLSVLRAVLKGGEVQRLGGLGEREVFAHVRVREQGLERILQDLWMRHTKTRARNVKNTGDLPEITITMGLGMAHARKHRRHIL